MSEITHPTLITEQKILNRIYVIRGQKIMLDQDLAEMYKVETRRLNEQVKRNINRFLEDFMFSLTQEEFDDLMSQIAISSDTAGWGGEAKASPGIYRAGCRYVIQCIE